MQALVDVQRSLRASPIFAFYILVTLGVAGIIGLITFDVIDLEMAHFGEASHRTHDVTYGMLFTTGVVGVIAQLRRPEKNVAGMLMALIPIAGLMLAAVLSGNHAIMQRNPLRYAAAVTAVAALVHPAGRGLLRSSCFSRGNWMMVALVGIAAAPLLAFASSNIRLQRSVTDVHGSMGHYGFMAAIAYTRHRARPVDQPASHRLEADGVGLGPPIGRPGGHVNAVPGRSLESRFGLGTRSHRLGSRVRRRR